MPTRDEDRPIPGVLFDDQRLAIEARFGVAPEQVVRDHVISHALAAIASLGTDDVVFFGGTALSRTHLTDLRLSEDIDLIALGDRREIGDRIESAITRQFQRSFGAVSFTPRIRDTRQPEPSVLQVGNTRVQIQLLSSEGYPAWPTEVVRVEQRYSDAAGAQLRVLTRAAFVASKLSSWNDRMAPRDLYDLWAMAEAGMIDGEAAQLFGRLGTYTSALQVPFTRVPSDAEWEAALGHQGIVQVGPQDAARRVSDVLRAL
ncbi:nucleotidyl transferase AbiEii/AbiGii toxin family protein [Microbacterium pygmaeum]|uniref:Predicted nucleotidyltransferase component of viral defense system n=1 Tax=Microbacterium pygmaeum TaxID=370764 RepID=A0A1G8DEP1_9MICO|nr:nucleotidyl transferase AbiEii/AbiGii toxin family protein [Microbacterium pygmaeum]SDH56178.1 Predicted nucleotidyltransferase component of viral defense system [Microbacterium pygmaeum]